MGPIAPRPESAGRAVADRIRPAVGFVLECRGLTKRDGERTVVDDVGITIDAGET